MRIPRLKLLLAFAVCAATASPPAAAQSVPGDSLTASSLSVLLAAVRSNNPMLQAARVNAAALGQREEQVSTLPDPTIMFTYQPFPVLTARGTQRTQFRVEQAIPYPGKLGLRGSLAALASDVASFDAATAEEELVVATKQTYYDLYRVGRQQSLIRSFQLQIAEFEAVATTQYTVGQGMQQAILKAQLERNTLDNQAFVLTRTRRTLLERLSRLTNRRVTDDSADSAAVDLPQPPAMPPPDLLALALATRPEAGAVGAAGDRADVDIALAEMEYYPDFGVNLTYFDIGAADAPPTANGQNALAIGVAVRVPLQRGRLKARLEEARLERQKIAYRQEAIETAFETEILDLSQQLTSDQDQLTLFKDALIPQATTTLEATLSAYTTGRTDFLNLLDAERMLFNLRWGYEEVYARYLKTTAALERALGVSWLSELIR
ncbi:MAG: cobalt-zinc-cadmium efflux system outer membrane protein [Rhodothermales bacterium]|jgi:cobalt-zinc-cadmium efflux system outer membrane protein